ncbi:MAG: hypothetical protein KDE14_13970 [Rhodobacteraceae bacterium]|nr:hypothetical protein [Paracoccaceae bacterium]
MALNLRSGLFAAGFLISCIGQASALPGYEQQRKELEAVMDDLIAWFPGAWDSTPQIYYEHTVAMPKDGEHEQWHRTFARIDAPQIGDVVFYGQINAGGRDGPIIGGSQVLYKAVIDEALGAVNIFGQGPADPEKYENLQDHPELWGEVKMRDPGALNCDWLWRRDGAQLFGVLQGNTPDKQQYGPGTCAFISKRTDAEFKADAEWVLTPDQLWLYDNNWSAGMLFLGREDQTHIKLYRSRPYTCKIKDADGKRTVDAYDRGYRTQVKTKDGKDATLMLLRAAYPAADGFGLDDRMKLMLIDGEWTSPPFTAADTTPLAKKITLEASGISATCKIADKFPPMTAN